MERLPFFLMLLLLIVALVQGFYYYPQLPSPMATHFDGHGHADGWSSPKSFFGVFYGAVLMCLLIFILSPLLLKKVPPKYINVPNKEYWMSAGRLDLLIRKMSVLFAWYGVATIALVTVAIQLTIQANSSPDKSMSMSGFWAALILYMVFNLVWLAVLFRQLMVSHNS